MTSVTPVRPSQHRLFLLPSICQMGALSGTCVMRVCFGLRGPCRCLKGCLSRLQGGSSSGREACIAGSAPAGGAAVRAL